MKLRYRKTGGIFIPQYQSGDNTWLDFEKKDVGRELHILCIAIGNIQDPRRYDSGQWHFKDPPFRLFFMKEIFVMAFLGAAKVYFDTDTKEFEL